MKKIRFILDIEYTPFNLRYLVPISTEPTNCFLGHYDKLFFCTYLKHIPHDFWLGRLYSVY